MDEQRVAPACGIGADALLASAFRRNALIERPVCGAAARHLFARADLPFPGALTAPATCGHFASPMAE